jgi:hypothetical protein
LLAALVAGLLGGDASAGSVGVTFGGHVTGTGIGDSFPNGADGFPVAVNNPINGSFTYNSSAPFTGSSSSRTYTMTGTGQSTNFGISTHLVGTTFESSFFGLSNPSGAYILTITNGIRGSTVDISSVLTNTGGKSGTITFDVKFVSSTWTVAMGLPTDATSFATAFSSSLGSFVWDPPPITGQSAGNPGISGVIDNVGGLSIPEPSSFALLSSAMAIGGIGLTISRRKLAKAS